MHHGVVHLFKAQDLSDKIAAIKAQIDKAGNAVSQNNRIPDNSSANNSGSATSATVGNNVNVFS